MLLVVNCVSESCSPHRAYCTHRFTVHVSHGGVIITPDDIAPPNLALSFAHNEVSTQAVLPLTLSHLQISVFDAIYALFPNHCIFSSLQYTFTTPMMSCYCFASALPFTGARRSGPYRTSVTFRVRRNTVSYRNIAVVVMSMSQNDATVNREQALREKLSRRRAIRRKGQSVSSLVLSTGILLASKVYDLPAASSSYFPTSLQEIVVGLLLVVSAFFRLEVGHHRDLYLSRRAPWFRHTVRDLDDLIEIGDASGKGKGAFARRKICKGTFLGPYRGELLDTAAFLTRYPVGERYGNYVMKIDSQYVCDGETSLVEDGNRFNPARMNHSAVSKHINVIRVWRRRERTVLFYTSRDVKVGEELCYDYGRDYWKGREHLELP